VNVFREANIEEFIDRHFNEQRLHAALGRGAPEECCKGAQ